MTLMTNVARDWAINAHADQVRKYTGEPYWHHCQRVVEIVQHLAFVNENMIVAAWLHDVVEDTPVTLQEIEGTFGRMAASFVAELTNVPSDHGNRRTRFLHNKERLRTASPQAQTIKLADVIDNAGSIARHDPNFAKVYLAEKSEVLEVLTKPSTILQYAARGVLAEAYNILKERELKHEA